MARKIHEIEIEVGGGETYRFRYRKASATYMLQMSDISPEQRKNVASAVGLLQDCLVGDDDKPYTKKQIEEILADTDAEVLNQLTVACTPAATTKDDAKNV